MPVRSAEARWEGDLQKGKGRMKFGDGAFDGAYSFHSRFEEGDGTNPEELIAAAHAGCFSMALSNVLAEAGYTPKSVETTARVRLEVGDEGPGITRIDLQTLADVPGIDAATFQSHAKDAKENCPVSKLVRSVEVKLDASLKGS